MNVKVCGIRTKTNLDYLNQSLVDQIGFIFFEKSKRNFDNGELSAADLLSVNKLKVGVFVNASLAFVKSKVEAYQLDVVQLHGEESPTYCLEAKELGVEVWKAFPVFDVLPIDLETYLEVVDVYLFDTKGKEKGGNGEQFDWKVLGDYKLNKPFVLSGGIGPDDVERLQSFKHKQLIGIDVNSKFEIEPGLKDENLLEEFINKIK